MLKSKCEYVLDVAHETVQNMCILGWHLRELKEGRTWEGVIEPKSGLAFFNFSFQDFCEYAFGFSHTRTSNLIRIAEFVKVSGTRKNGFIDERYAGYNTSQLVELAPVQEDRRHFFNPEMSVATMRVCKDYMKMGSFFEDQFEKDFDLKTYAEAWKEGKQQKAVSSAPAQIPGQMQMEEIEVGFEELETEDPHEPAFFQGGGLDEDPIEEEYVEELPEEEEKSDVGFIIAAPMDEPEEVFPAETQREDKHPDYKFITRDDIRFFTGDYKNWNRREDERLKPFAKSCYWYTLKTFDIVYALDVTTVSNEDLINGEQCDEPETLYFIYRAKFGPESNVISLGKRQLENYLMAKRDELGVRR
ncbi:MAG: hypothetical protein IIX02_02010 [Clostridia bacterium]|nr:hypothetical protein [Clostridia bacterium]